MKSPFLCTLVKVLIIVGMLVGVGAIVFIVDCMLTIEWPVSGAPLWIAGSMAIVCVLLCEYIAVVLFKMMRTLNKDPFVVENVKALRQMGWTALAVMAIGLLTLVVCPVPLAVMASLPVGMCGLFSLVLSGVFEKAVAFKEENDLTV